MTNLLQYRTGASIFASAVDWTFTMTYEEAVAYIDATPKFTKKNSLDHTRAFLKRLGDPLGGIKVIHVAGTNGKGSVCAFISSIFMAGGKHTGLFTSPHLVKVNERFSVDGRDITDDEFMSHFQTVMACVEEMGREGYPHPTYFELLFLIGAVWFKEAGVEYLVLETGLGGRLDATNSVERPLITVITSISLDHTEYLGDTVAAIAGEKAGIIKAGVPVVYDASDAEAAGVIEAKAGETGAPAYAVTPQMCEIKSATDKSIDFCLNSGYHNSIYLTIGSVALYQVRNAALAVTAVRLIDTDGSFPDPVIQKGISRMRWRGRMETVLPGVIVDGAHNAAGVAQFVETAVRLGKDRDVTLLFAAVNDKDYPHMIETICRRLPFARAVVTEVGGYRSVDVNETAALFARFSEAPVAAIKDVSEAFREALSEKGGGLLFCVGSLYLTGAVEAAIEKGKMK